MSFSFAVTVIVPVYNHWHLVPALLESLAHQSFGTDRFELLLVDNGSDFIPSDLLPSWARVLHCAVPGSYAARNEGVRVARGAFFVFTDADCRPRQHWLSHLVRAAIAEDSRALIAGGVLMEPADWKTMTASEVFDVVMGLPQARYVRHGYAVTANLLVPALAFAEVGLFDGGRFSGGDAEFCRRAVSHGWRLKYCAEAEVMHPARVSWDELRTKQRRVKGGQLSAGRLQRRWLYGLMTLMPPIHQVLFALSSERVVVTKRLQVCVMLIRLWGVGVIEMARIVFGRTPERR